MTNGWQEVPLGKVLKRADRFEKKDDLQTYHFAGTYSFARGIFAGAVKEGSTFGLDKIQRIKKGDFIYCKIMAWEGAFGIAPEKVDDCVMSGAFVAYEVDQTQIYPKFLDYYFKQEPVWKSIGSQSTGTNVRRRSLHPDQFEKATIPFPPLDEQRRIVGRVEAFADRISKAESLREEADTEADSILSSALFHIFDINNQHWKSLPMPEAIEINDRQVDPTLPEYSKLPHISGENMESKTCKLLPYRTADVDGVRSSNYLFSPNTILYSKIRPYLRKAVYIDFQGVCSADVYPIKINNPELDIKFVMWSLVANPFSEYANTLSGRTRMPKLNRNQLFAFTFKYPPLDEQRRIVAYLDSVQARLASLRELQSQTGEELDALLPSVLDRAFKGEL